MDWKAIIGQGEGETLEFKRSTDLLNEAVQTLCAMANRSGGTVIFGINDNGSTAGQQVSDDTLRAISQAVQLNTEPRLYPTIEKIDIDGTILYSGKGRRKSRAPAFRLRASLDQNG